MKLNRDSLMLVVFAVAQAGLTYASTHGYVSKDDAQTFADVLLAFGVAYHIPNASASQAIRQAKAVASSDTATATDPSSTDETASAIAMSPRGDM